jgi:hypothetical protein
VQRRMRLLVGLAMGAILLAAAVVGLYAFLAVDHWRTVAGELARGGPEVVIGYREYWDKHQQWPSPGQLDRRGMSFVSRERKPDNILVDHFVWPADTRTAIDVYLVLMPDGRMHVGG